MIASGGVDRQCGGGGKSGRQLARFSFERIGAVTLEGARLTADGAALINLEEVVVHNWDLAKATGQDLAIDPDIAQTIYDWGLTIGLDGFRAHGAFGPEVVVPASAPISDRLMGLLGRQP
jgi:uncharacterized protein (TIGR03086 family)